MAIGTILTGDGIGTPTSVLAGQRIIMAAGFSSTAKDGSGYLAMNGRQPGFLGATRKIIAVGRLFPLNAGVSPSELA